MICTLRQLQEKYWEQMMPPDIGFSDLSKALGFKRKDLFQLQMLIGYHQQLLGIIIFFHENMHVVLSYYGEI